MSVKQFCFLCVISLCDSTVCCCTKRVRHQFHTIGWVPYYSHPTLSPLVQNHWTHRIQAPLALTKFSQLPNLHTFISSFLFNVRVVLALHPSLLLLLLHHPQNYWSLLSVCFTVSLESAPYMSLSTSFWYQFLQFRLTYYFTRHFFSSSDWPLCSSMTPSFFHFWLKTYLFHKSLLP